MSPRRRTPLLATLAAVALVTSSCAVDVSDITRIPGETSSAPGTVVPGLDGVPASECPSSLTDEGADLLAERRRAPDAPPMPRFDIDAAIDPTTGTVDGTLSAAIPADDDRIRFRVFAGMAAFDSDLTISAVTVDGTPVLHELDRSLLTVENPEGSGTTVDVSLDFDYRIDQRAANENLLGALTGDTLQPDQVGLLGTTEAGMQLGHWFPVWMPNGTRTDPDPSGFGDIGAFAAAVICADVTVPDGYTVVSSGARFADDGATVSESATGIRDFAMLISNDLEMVKGTVEGVEVRVWGPSGDREALQTVLDHALVSQQALHDAFGRYPWTEVDIVSAPLGGGVGGMEWPGMIWIERSLFAGGIPGDGPALAVTDQDTVTYCISVANPGTFTATNVVVTDPQNPNGAIAVGALAGQSEQTFSYDIQVHLDTPTTNTATAAGLGPDGPLPAVSDTAVISVARLPEPELAIVKTVLEGPGATCPSFDAGAAGIGSALAVDEGDTVTYCISVRNTGPGDATSVVVSDPQAPAGFNGAIPALAAGADAGPLSFDLVVTTLTPSINTATVTGAGPYGAVSPASDDALIDVSPLPDPALAIVKTVVAGPNGTCPDFAGGVIGAGAALPVVFGETVTYCIAVANQSGSTATDVVVTDAQAPVGFDGAIGTLAVGEERVLSYDVVVDAAPPALNTAVVNGSGPNGPVPTDTDQAVIDPSPQPDPVLQIVKTVVAGPNGTCPASFADGVQGLGPALPVEFDDTVTYCLNVINAAGSDATDVVVSDPQAPAGFDGAIGDLAVGAEAARSFDLVVTAATPSVNTAAVGGAGPNGAVPDDTDQAQINANPQPDPQLQIVKTVVAGPNGTCPATFADGIDGLGASLPVLFGDTVTYCLSVTNAGGTDATDVTITDPQAPAGFDGAIGSLAVGAEAARSFDVVVDASTPEVNTASVAGVGPNGPAPSDSDQARIVASPLPDPILDIVKTVVPGPNGTCPGYEQGVQGVGPELAVLFDSTVTYCLSVENSSGSA